jgi:hypothetical protein
VRVLLLLLLLMLLLLLASVDKARLSEVCSNL